MAKMRKDQYANRAYGGVTMSAADTLTFSQIQTGVSIFERVAWVIHRIKYIPSKGTWQEMDAETDTIDIAVCLSDNLDDLAQDQAAVVDVGAMNVLIAGTPADIVRFEPYIEHDFSEMPGGGLIIPGSGVFIGMDSAGMVNPGEANVIIYFSYQSMSDADYIELVQAMQMIR